MWTALPHSIAKSDRDGVNKTPSAHWNWEKELNAGK